MSLFNELKRRNVFRVAVAYAVIAWVLIQMGDILFSTLELGPEPAKILLAMLLLGFIPAIIFSWAFEITSEGIKKEKDVTRDESVTNLTAKKLDMVTIGLLVVAIGLFGLDRFSPRDIQTAETVQKTQADSGFSEGSITNVSSEVVQAVSEKSIAVLPFADLSQAKDQEWFADGLAEEILNALAKTPDLLVTSRTSSFRYKGSTLDLKDIATELGVANVLEGSVRSSPDRIRVTAQLIRASDGFHIWSQNYDRDIADMIAIQEDLALNIANALETTMDPEALAEMTSVGTRSVDAYQAYLHGVSLEVQSRTKQNAPALYLQAEEQFERASDLDPDFAAAHYQIAAFWLAQLTSHNRSARATDLDSGEQLRRFNASIDRAIATAPTETDRHGYLALKAVLDNRFKEAVRLFGLYLEARPNDHGARDWQLEIALVVNDLPTQRRIFDHLTKHIFDNVDMATVYCNEAYNVSDEPVVDTCLQALKRWPNHEGLLYQAHRAILWRGEVAEARKIKDRYIRLFPEGNVLLEARQACAEGRRDWVEKAFANATGQDYRWHLLKLLGRDAEASKVLREMTDSAVPYTIAAYLGYSQFDPTPFPEVMEILEREGINRPPSREIPFKCPPPKLGSPIQKKIG